MKVYKLSLLYQLSFLIFVFHSWNLKNASFGFSGLLVYVMEKTLEKYIHVDFVADACTSSFGMTFLSPSAYYNIHCIIVFYVKSLIT